MAVNGVKRRQAENEKPDDGKKAVPADAEPHWGFKDIVAMCLAMFDILGPVILIIAGLLVVIALLVTQLGK